VSPWREVSALSRFEGEFHFHPQDMGVQDLHRKAAVLG